ncbi:putative DNA binding domain-containing protein [Bifidobacterium sp. ESL0728]|uniref:RNA-binding domain-containing protein n=1 Tax=Bifidobacterium sp. ESL0728 TaxID=2983220 RepID=UPI0023F9D6D6|nr:RNA-binding domain-containing protein [Bifidobacterium sp. ESL0728]WEV58992.1 putative DNA binding domain-containing protein [Bifidobacterium sp. ESL0728]
MALNLKEGTHVEFKRQWSNSARHALSAFANTDGGTIYLGIDDDGSVVGVPNPDEAMRQASQAASDGIRPDIMSCVSIEEEEYENLPVIAVHVQRGTNRPYYLPDKGISPGGIYIRSGSASIPASETAILDMIKITSGYSFENEISVNQELTFIATKNVFKEHEVDFDRSAYKTLGLVNTSDEFTNLAYLLSDQCDAQTYVAKFNGTAKMTFENRLDCSGSLFSQFEQASRFLRQYNTVSSYTGADGYRVEHYDYQPSALREALLNLIIHRDYSYRTSPATISIFDDRIEFLDLGPLPEGITKADIMKGTSAQINPKLAAIFYRLHLVEAYGTGIKKILTAYLGQPDQPDFVLTDHVFKLILPIMNGNKPNIPAIDDLPMKDSNSKTSDNKQPIFPSLASQPQNTTNKKDHRNQTEKRRTLIIEYTKSHGIINRSRAEELTGLSQPGASKLLKRLVEEGTLERIGAGPKTAYKIKG